MTGGAGEDTGSPKAARGAPTGGGSERCFVGERQDARCSPEPAAAEVDRGEELGLLCVVSSPALGASDQRPGQDSVPASPQACLTLRRPPRPHGWLCSFQTTADWVYPQRGGKGRAGGRALLLLHPDPTYSGPSPILAVLLLEPGCWVPHQLCDLGHVPSPLWASVSHL